MPSFMDNKVVYWQARATWEEPGNKDFKKVLNPKGVSARPILYNFDVAKKFEEIVIVEGFIDAVKAGSNAVATNGKRLHDEQIEWLSKTSAKTIILAWDLDAWTDAKRMRDGTLARKKDGTLVKPCSMKRATEKLRARKFDVRCVKMPAGRDPGSYPYNSEELKRILKSARRPKFSTSKI